MALDRGRRVVVGGGIGAYFLLRDPHSDPVEDPENAIVQTLGAARSPAGFAPRW